MPNDDAKNAVTGGGNDGASWFDAFPEVKADEALVASLTPYKSPVEAFKALGAGWGGNWREAYAGTDEKKLGQLQRYATPKAALDGLFSAQERIRSGELVKPLPDNANEQEVTEYRKAHGIPEKPDGYLANLPDGLVIGEEDKPIFESFATALHGLNADPKIAHAAVKWYNDFAEQQQAELVKADTSAKAATEDALRAEWGKDYRTNISVMQSYLDTMPKAVSEAFMGARSADGMALFNLPEFVQWFVGNAREMNSVTTLVGADGKPPGQSVDDEIKTIETFMRTNRADYNKDEAKQARLRDLYDARGKLQQRAQTKAA